MLKVVIAGIKRASIMALILLCQNLLVAQEMGSITGEVSDENGQPLAGITVQIEGTPAGAVTDLEGKFTISGVGAGKKWLIISGIGYKRLRQSVEVLPDQQAIAEIQLDEDVIAMNEVVVHGKSEATEMREKAYAIQVIEAKQFQNVSTDINQILNKVSGVNIRQDGGLGSDFSLSLNGLTGNQVRTFINGIPMDYFGSSLTLNNFPANIISGIEVYKGVVPIHLSSDALGGAINITTDHRPINYLDASYSVGSFNTHRMAINSQWYNANSGATFRLRSFYNHSDNDYRIDVNLLDLETGKLNTETTEVRRFHDAYSSRMIWLEGGLTNKTYADELMIGVMYSDNSNDLQQPPQATGTASIPLGEVTQEEDKRIANFSYRKEGLLNGKLGLSSFFVLVDSRFTLVDSSSHRYDWHGGRAENVHTTTGEVERKTVFNLDRFNVLGNVNAEYALNKNHNVSVNLSLNRMTLEGEDELHGQKNTQYSEPSTVDKKVVGFAYTNHLLAEKLSTTAFGKWYRFDLNSLQTNYSGSDRIPFENTKSEFGFGLASTYFFTEQLQLKASFEKAIRFPESEELFGNGLLIEPNPLLGPERSENYNLGVRYNQPTGNSSGLLLDANLFIRDSEDFMRIESIGVLSSYENQASVLAKGIDLTIQYSFNERLRVSTNGTYQDLRNNGRWVNGVEGGKPDPFYEDRIPNQPYLFGNMAVSYSLDKLFNSQDNFSITSIHNYVHDFFFNWPSLASSSTKAEIPAQYTHDLELIYMLLDGKYNISLTASNVFDEKVFDNFNQQKPGRAFAVKARVFLTQ